MNQLSPVLKEWVENIASENACTTVIPYAKRKKIIDMWFDPANNYDLDAIARAVGVEPRAAAVIVGSHPLVREVEESMHRAKLYQLRRQLDTLQQQVVDRMQKLLDSKKPDDWDKALSQIRKYLATVDKYLQLPSPMPVDESAQMDFVIDQIIESMDDQIDDA